MKYIHSEYSQFKHVSDVDANALMESCGYDTDTEVVDRIDYMKHDTAYYALSQEIVESDDGIFLKVDELPGNSELNETTHFHITEVEYDGGDYELEGVYESSDGVYTKLVPIQQEEEVEDSFIEYADETYRVVESEEEADYVMYVSNTDADGEYTVVEESDGYDEVIYLATLEENKEKGYKKNGKSNGDDDDNGDPKAFGGKKGDKSKTHKGEDFEKNGNGNGDDDDDDDDNGDPKAFGGKKGDKSKTHKGLDFVKKGKKKLKKK